MALAAANLEEVMVVGVEALAAAERGASLGRGENET
jgi:hypothetical protein